MKIIQINCVYAKGSTGKIVYNLHTYLEKTGENSIVCYGRGDKTKDRNVYKVSGEFEAKIHSLQSKIFGIEFAHSPIATGRLIEIIKNEHPDIVHLHCLNGHFVNVYKLLWFLKENKVQTVLTLHAEIMHTAGCEHAVECQKWRTHCKKCKSVKGLISQYFRDDAMHCFNLMHNAVANFETLTVVGVSKWLTNRCLESAIFKDSKAEFVTIYNGVNIDIFRPQLEKKCLPKKEAHRKPVILHVTPNFNHALKGGKYVIEVAKKHPEWTVIIVGIDNDEINLPNIVVINKTNNQEELAQIYSEADVTIITSKRETFSMVCAESLCCGTPVVGFECGGPESVFQNRYCHFVKYGDVNLLCEKIKEVLRNKIDSIECSDLASTHYADHEMCERYYKLYKSKINVE